MAFSERDVKVVSQTAWGEARGEGDTGIIAVIWAIKNRVETDLGNDGKPDWWGEGYDGVCLKRSQFSCWLPSDPNRAKMEALDDSNDVFRHIRLNIAPRVMRGEIPDPTNGATHYLTKAAFNESPPGHWCRKALPCAIIGGHMFFKGV